MKKIIILFIFSIISSPCFADEVFVQVRFSKETKFGTFQDALYFTEDEYAIKTQDEINTLKEERVANYIDKIENAPPPVELTKEQLISFKEELLRQVAEVEEKIAEHDEVIP